MTFVIGLLNEFTLNLASEYEEVSADNYNPHWHHTFVVTGYDPGVQV